jgi:hypothetical protein
VKKNWNLGIFFKPKWKMFCPRMVNFPHESKTNGKYRMSDFESCADILISGRIPQEVTIKPANQ